MVVVRVIGAEVFVVTAVAMTVTTEFFPILFGDWLKQIFLLVILLLNCSLLLLLDIPMSSLRLGTLHQFTAHFVSIFCQHSHLFSGFLTCAYFSMFCSL
jgi:hypothetical protein